MKFDLIMFREGLFKIDEEAEKAAKRYSIIHWKTGQPAEEGEYLVSLEDGSVCRDEWRKLYCDDEKQCWVYNEGEIIAWCKLSDIEPYKPKDDGIIPF